jgi:hypothetical protein
MRRRICFCESSPALRQLFLLLFYVWYGFYSIGMAATTLNLTRNARRRLFLQHSYWRLSRRLAAPKIFDFPVGWSNQPASPAGPGYFPHAPYNVWDRIEWGIGSE